MEKRQLTLQWSLSLMGTKPCFAVLRHEISDNYEVKV